nr:MAG TPA: hypothetical protein [Caudoviricetes sp.]
MNKHYLLICELIDLCNLGIKKTLLGKLPMKNLFILVKGKFLMSAYKRRLEKIISEDSQICSEQALEQVVEILLPKLQGYEEELHIAMQRLLDL